jgi:hypothetical protein
MITIIQCSVRAVSKVDGRSRWQKIKDFIYNVHIEHKFWCLAELVIQGNPSEILVDTILTVAPGIKFKINGYSKLDHTMLASAQSCHPMYEFEVADLNSRTSIHATISHDAILFIE